MSGHAGEAIATGTGSALVDGDRDRLGRRRNGFGHVSGDHDTPTDGDGKGRREGMLNSKGCPGELRLPGTIFVFRSLTFR